ncbi:Sugar (pentulose or hexulose) kinase [Colwellia chukchiensis]|uniref:Sugar (Pentulose or hexulose) kinase n=1 Tax=Colwellia chukchiensis TaxID=641665 RepID=A0A1H7QC23_9GAMM|nr:FGGY-family carbohydrate kinase [Colwellia chukchiensis]SEL45308.1 Sugar (pentulose or hexulose) kinase [Colwellia chukchiensis]
MNKANPTPTADAADGNAANSDDLILTIDNGTQSVRALLFDLQGNLVAKSRVELEAYFSTQPGWAEQSVEYFWQMLGLCCQQLWQQAEVKANGYREKVSAVTLTTQRGTVINLDKHGQPLRPAILWLDQRLAEPKHTLPWYWRLAFSVLGQRKVLHYFLQKSPANWLQQNQAQLWQNTDKFLLLSGYLSYQLTGQFKDSVASIVGYLPFNYKKQHWAHAWDWKWYALPVKKSMLPDLVKPGDILGEINAAAAKHTGIAMGTKLIAAASDKACEVLGSGCISPETASLSYGTTATINTNNTRYVEPHTFIPPYPSAIPGQYNSEVMIYRGFWMVNWFKQEFGQNEIDKAQQLGVSAESLFDQLVAQVPPGSMGLMLQPYWSPGLKNLDAKGAIIGFGDVHTRAHIYRSILEGLAYALREGKENLAKRQQCKITRLMVSGGGSQSDAALQLTADIFNLPTHRPHTFETSGLGAAINAAVGQGYFGDYQQATAAMTRTTQTFLPNPDNVELYEQLYTQVYKKMYRQLKPIYQAIKNITGYPN